MMTRSLSWPPDLCRDTSDVPRRETAPSHLITHFSARSVVTGSYGKIVLPVDGQTTTRTSPARPMAGRQAPRCARFASIRPKIAYTTSGANAAAGR